jgi:anti-anti-sigma factor
MSFCCVKRYNHLKPLLASGGLAAKVLGMDISGERGFAYELERTSQSVHFSRVLVTLAHRVTSRSRALCLTVHERRRRPDFSHRLAKYVQMVPRMRRYLPLAGGDGDLLHIETEERAEGMVAHVSGEVDLANVDRFKGALQPALSPHRNVILDVSNLRYIDSTGFHVLVNTSKELRQHNCQLVVVGASPSIAKVMRILRLDGLVPLVPSFDGAIDLLRIMAPGSAANGS